MASFQFDTYSYVTSETTPRVMPIRMNVDLAVVIGNLKTPVTTTPERVHSSGNSRKKYGVHARYFTMARKIGVAGGYTGGTTRVKVAVCAPTAMPKVGDVLAYGGKVDWVVVSVTPELIK